MGLLPWLQQSWQELAQNTLQSTPLSCFSHLFSLCFQAYEKWKTQFTSIPTKATNHRQLPPAWHTPTPFSSSPFQQVRPSNVVILGQYSNPCGVICRYGQRNDEDT
ncbi:hypothetical protein SLA2020_420960 [Shorea laevis]